jgi:hypothetical protein
MWTTALAYVIMLMGFITFASGGLGAMILLFEEVGKTERVPWRYYAVVVGLISCGCPPSALIGQTGWIE